MRDRFHQAMDDLKDEVAQMGDLARWMLSEGVDALVKLDRAKATAVLAKRDELADMDDRIEEKALMLVARQQPMARDMRAIAGALKLITYINRVGRYGKDIAQVCDQWQTEGHVHRLVQLPVMAEILIKMFDHTLDAYKGGKDVDLVQLLDWEEVLDEMRWGVFRECVTLMAERNSNIEPCSYYMLIARYIERAGDNVCKMAEKTHYVVTGERVTVK